MNGNRKVEEAGAWSALAESFRLGVAETSGELPPFGLATAVVARWKEDRSHWEYGALEWLSVRWAVVSSVVALAAWCAWSWNFGPVPGDEWMDLPPLEDVAW